MSKSLLKNLILSLLALLLYHSDSHCSDDLISFTDYMDALSPIINLFKWKYRYILIAEHMTCDISLCKHSFDLTFKTTAQHNFSFSYLKKNIGSSKRAKIGGKRWKQSNLIKFFHHYHTKFLSQSNCNRTQIIIITFAN